MENAAQRSFSAYQQPGDTTSPSLVDALRHGDSSAWGKIAIVWGTSLIDFFRRKGFSAEDADDLTQTVLAKMYRGFSRFERDGVRLRMVHWIFDIARKEAITFRKRSYNKPNSPGGDAHQEAMAAIPDLMSPANDGQEIAAFESTAVNQIMNLIQTDFQPNTWKAFWRFKVDGLTAEEAGKEVGMSAGAVRVGTNRIIKRIREDLDGPSPSRGD